MTTDKIALYNIEAEKYVIGCLIFDSNSINDVVDILDNKTFYFEANNLIYETIIELYTSGIICDMITLTNKLKKKGILEKVGNYTYISECMSNVASSGNIIANAFEIKELYYKRLADNFSAKINKKAKEYQSDIEEIMSMVDNFQLKFVTELNTLSGSQIKDSEVRLEQKIKFEPHFLSILQNEKFFGVMSKNNLSAIIGKAKSRKTFLATKFAAAICKGNITDGLIWAKNSKIIYFDTEQSRLHIQRVIERVCKCLEIDHQPDNFKMYALKQYDVDTRKRIIETIVKKDRPDIIFIDGIRDLILDFNDLREASLLINWLMKLIDKYNCHISNIIHVNKADSNPRGHLGTEIVNKCETVIEVELDTTDITRSTVTAKYMRDEKFEPFSIEIIAGVPYAISDYTEKKHSNNLISF